MKEYEGIKFSAEGHLPYTLSIEDYGKVISFYALEDKPAVEIYLVLQSKYLTGDLQITAHQLRNY